MQLAGGANAVAARAGTLAATDPLKALYLTDLSLAVDSKHRPSLEVRLAVLQAIDAQSGNSNERGWLAAAVREVESRLKQCHVVQRTSIQTPAAIKHALKGGCPRLKATLFFQR